MCRKIKRDDCERCKPKPFEGINRGNQSLYNDSKWRKYSLSLRKKNPLCSICLEQGRTTPCAVVDHIIPIDKGGSFWDKDNHRCLCHKCHNKKSASSKK